MKKLFIALLAGGLVASVFANGYTAPLVVEVLNDNLDLLSNQTDQLARMARTVPGLCDARSSLQMNYPEIRVETDREKAGMVIRQSPPSYGHSSWW